MRDMSNVKIKCSVFGCENTSDKGYFAGSMCFPCHEMLRTGEVESGTSFIHKLKSTTIVDMIMFCPQCHARHIDQGIFATKPHHTHACQTCGFTWRPAVVHTRGVQFLPGFRDVEVKSDLPDRTSERDAIIDWLEKRGCLGEVNAVRWWNRPRSNQTKNSAMRLNPNANTSLDEASIIAAWLSELDNGITQPTKANDICVQDLVKRLANLKQAAWKVCSFTQNCNSPAKWIHSLDLVTQHPRPRLLCQSHYANMTDTPQRNYQRFGISIDKHTGQDYVASEIKNSVLQCNRCGATNPEVIAEQSPNYYQCKSVKDCDVRSSMMEECPECGKLAGAR